MELFEYLKREYKSLVIIFVLFLINLLLFNHKMINVHTDFGREVFFSALVSKGAIVYKDFFNTFLCPFSYLFNGLLLKIFPANLTTFFITGAANALLILLSVFFISRNFLNRTISTVITVFVMYYCCFYAGLMNYLTPYSYAIVYGLSACLISVLLFLKYIKTDKKSFLYLSFLFAGVSASNKYEFVLYAVFLTAFLIYLHRENLKSYLKSFLCLFLTPAVCLIVLFAEGLRFGDLKNYFEIFSSFVNQPYLKKVYEATFYFNSHSLVYLGKCIIIASAVLFFANRFFQNKSKIWRFTGFLVFLSMTSSVLFSLDSMNYFSYDFLSFLPILITILVILKYKKIINDKSVLFLSLASLIISIKTYWMLIGNFYGRYFLPLLIISLVVILKRYYILSDEDKIFSKSICFILIFLSFASFRLNLVSLVLKNTLVQTQRGIIFEQKETAENFKSLVKYTQNNIDDKETLVVLGDAPLLNFLTDTKSLNFYSHFDEAIFGAYGEERIIKAYKKAKPGYFIVTKTFCGSYGKRVCTWLNNDYKLIKTTAGDKYGIYKKRI